MAVGSGLLYRGVAFDGATYYAGANLALPASQNSQRGLVNYWYNSTTPPAVGSSQTILAAHSPGSAYFGASKILLYVTHQNLGGNMIATVAETRQPGVNLGGDQWSAQSLGQPLIYDGNWHCVTIAWDASRLTPGLNQCPWVQFAHDGIQNTLLVSGSGSNYWPSLAIGLDFSGSTFWLGSTPYLPAQADVAYRGALANVFCHLYDSPFIDPVNSDTPPFTEMCRRIVYNGAEFFEPGIIGQDVVGQRIFGVAPTIHLIGDIDKTGSGHNAGPLFLANNGHPFVLGAGAMVASATGPQGPGPHP